MKVDSGIEGKIGPEDQSTISKLLTLAEKLDDSSFNSMMKKIIPHKKKQLPSHRITGTVAQVNQVLLMN